jgi:hypothetical protein
MTDQRTALDFAVQMKALVDVHYPEAAKIRVVLDNLRTHTPWALHNAFAPEEARRILRKLEFRHTPKHGSWLNMAEIELSVRAASASTADFPPPTPSGNRWTHGRTRATRRMPQWLGALPPITLANG